MCGLKWLNIRESKGTPSLVENLNMCHWPFVSNIGKKNDSSKTEYTQEAFQGFHRQSCRSATPEICGWRSLCSLHVGSKCQSNPWDQNAALVTEVSLGGEPSFFFFEEKHNVALYSVRAKEASTPKHRLECAQKVDYFFLSTILCV